MIVGNNTLLNQYVPTFYIKNVQNGQALVYDSVKKAFINIDASGTGSVSSVNASGGTTGLIFTGGPIVSSGTLTLGGVLDLSSGGTGATNRNSAANNILPNQSGNIGKFLKTDGVNVSWQDISAGGTVTSVNAVGTNGVSITGAPITTSGTLNVSLTPTGVSAGTYINSTVTVDMYGRIISISNGSQGAGTVTSVSVVGSTGRIVSNGGPITTTGTITLDLSTTGVIPGFYTNTNIAVDVYGRITSISNGAPISSGTVTSVAVTGASGRITSGGGPITTAGTITLDLATTGVTPATYGSLTAVPSFTIDSYGRVTSASEVVIPGLSSPIEMVVFRYSSGSSGNLSQPDAIYSFTSGVTPTITDGVNCFVSYSFTGKSNPPKSILTYGQIYTTNTFSIKTPVGATTAIVAGGGSSNSPNIINGIFSTSNTITLQHRPSDTGAVGGLGQRAFLIVVFGF
jgi:hypothetical protein